MDDYILPDDNQMQQLAAEYAKIKAKTFCGEEKTTVACADAPKRVPSCNYFLLTLASAVILKSINSR